MNDCDVVSGWLVEYRVLCGASEESKLELAGVVKYYYDVVYNSDRGIVCILQIHTRGVIMFIHNFLPC